MKNIFNPSGGSKKGTNEYICTDCNEPVSADDKVCPNCGADLSETVQENNDYEETYVPYVFKSLIFYASLVSTIGGIQIIVGIIMLIFAIDNNYSSTVLIVVGISLVVSGLPIIAFGQFLIAHVAIEKNTRETNAMLRYIIKNYIHKD